ncbi:MAG TPA: hypothetical protein VJ736_10095 [Actinomycetota bacterium]|jgi:hypothetical protein|nr:hypothetical protein [Actinomycetota bacterium]
MEIDAFLADSVQAAGGKLHALGIGWQVIQASAFPVRHDRIGLGLVVRTTPDEAGAHTLSISLVDPKGEARSFGDKPSFEATFASPDGEGTATLALNLDGLVFEIEGAHTIVLGIDGAEAARLPFRVQTLPGQPPSEFRSGVYL